MIPGLHWWYIYKKRRQVFGIKTPQIAAAQVVALIGAILAGLHLESNKASLILVAGAFVVLPGVFDLDGSIGAALSAKINHKMQEGRIKTWRIFLGSVSYALLIASLGGLLVSAAGAAIAAFFFSDVIFYEVARLAYAAIMLSALLGFPLVGIATIIVRKAKINPDDVVTPVESSVFDMLTVITMSLVIGWLA